jgi:hypothetical protein
VRRLALALFWIFDPHVPGAFRLDRTLAQCRSSICVSTQFPCLRVEGAQDRHEGRLSYARGPTVADDDDSRD